jgi:Tat protein translocase TatC
MILKQALFNMRSTFDMIAKEVQIRTIWITICVLMTCCCCYSLSEELLFVLVKPFIIIYRPHSGFISTQLTEMLSTYVITCVVFSVIFCTPYLMYQLWCLLIPGWNRADRERLARMCQLNALALCIVFFISTHWMLPNLWYLLYQLNNTTSHIFVIELQPKIYDFAILTLRMLSVLLVCSQIPLVLIWLIQANLILAKHCIRHRKSAYFGSVLAVAMITPPDLWCELVILLPIAFAIEVTLLYSILCFHCNQLLLKQQLIHHI